MSTDELTLSSRDETEILITNTSDDFKPDADNSVTCVIRYHSTGNFALLLEALKSLSLQSHSNLEIILCCQNCASLRVKIDDALKSFWPNGIQFQALNIETSEDRRTRLLNLGVNRAAGRYLSLLDYDDVLLEHFYSSLIERLAESKHAIAVAGSVCSYGIWKENRWVERDRNKPFKKSESKWELLEGNFIPIHSFLVDLSKVDRNLLGLDETMNRCEDYLLLLQIASKHSFDFFYQQIALCEYRIRDDASNTTLLGRNNTVNNDETTAWAAAESKLKEHKNAIKFEISCEELEPLIRSQKETRYLKETIEIYEAELQELRNLASRRSVKMMSQILEKLGELKAKLKR